MKTTRCIKCIIGICNGCVMPTLEIPIPKRKTYFGTVDFKGHIINLIIAADRGSEDFEIVSAWADVDGSALSLEDQYKVAIECLDQIIQIVEENYGFDEE